MADKESEVCLLASKFHNMVAKEAHRVWRTLPSHTRVWVSVEDIMQDGMIKLVTEIIPKLNKERASLSTFAYRSIRNYLDDEYTVKFGGRTKKLPSGRRWYQRHNEGSTVGIEDLVVTGRERRNCWDALHSMARNLVQSDMSRECWVVPTLLEIHTKASNELKSEIVHWFLTNERLRLDTPKFCSCCKEFRSLASECGFDVEDCRHLFQSPVCMDQLSRELRWVPYNLEHPTPALAHA